MPPLHEVLTSVHLLRLCLSFASFVGQLSLETVEKIFVNLINSDWAFLRSWSTSGASHKALDRCSTSQLLNFSELPGFSELLSPCTLRSKRQASHGI